MNALVQQSTEWLEMRRSKIGASDAPVIMGVSPWMTPRKLWQEKLQMVEPRFQNRAMKYGIEKEEEARISFINQTGIDVSPDVLFHKELPFMMASLDGISTDKKHIVEIKCVSSIDHETAKAGIVPEKYYPQLQHQLEVCELETAFYFSYKNAQDFSLVKVVRDDKYIKKMISREREFWDCMNDFIEPALTEKDYVVKDDPVWSCTAEEWLDLVDRLRNLEGQEKELRAILISQAGSENCMGSGIQLSRIVKKGNVDYSAIPELKTVDLDKYRKKSIETWRLTAI